jgi:exodeoxyribonuclease VII small subunit
MAKKNQEAPRNFEEAVKELEQIVSEMERGQVSLEESLARYERGQFLIRHCQEILGVAEKQIEQITKSSEGTLKTSPLEEKSGDSH